METSLGLPPLFAVALLGCIRGLIARSAAQTVLHVTSTGWDGTLR